MKFSEKQNKKIKILNQFQKKFENKTYKIENL